MDYTLLAVAVAALGAFVVAKQLGLLGGAKIVKLSVQQYTEFPLIEKIDVIPPEVGCHTILFRFGLPTGARLALPIGQHLSIKGFNSEKALVIRQYTPTTSADTVGHFDVIIKIYPNGQLGNYLKQLPVGSMVAVKGPLGSLSYTAPGRFTIRRKQPDNTVVAKNYAVTDVGMLAGGSGVTPMLQLIRHVTAHAAQDRTRLSLLLGNQSEGDIMCRAELEAAAEANPNFKLHFMVDRAPAATGWRYGVGFITKDLIQQRLPAPGPNTLVLLCGPPPMVAAMTAHLASLGYTEDMIFAY